MAVFQIARYEVRPEARLDAERAMHDFASFVRQNLPDSTWSTYRDPAAPTRFFTVFRAQGADLAKTKAFIDSLEPHLAGKVELTDCELVTSSDLARRPKRR